MKNYLLGFKCYTSFKMIFVQQLGGEMLHISLHLWTAMNTSFDFLCFIWIRHIFAWTYHLSPDLNYGQ